MDGAPAEATPISALPTTDFEDEGVSWIARETGRTAIGSETSSRAALMQVAFSKQEQPEVVAFEAFVVADSLEALSLDQLVGLLRQGRRR